MPDGAAAKSAADARLAKEENNVSLVVVKHRKATMVSNAPVTNDNAPTATCAVAMSVDLLVQIVAAPKTICATIKPNQPNESFVKAWFRPSHWRDRHTHTETRKNMPRAVRRCAI